MIRILVDSSADYYKEELEEKHIELVPLMITVNDTTTYRDEVELSRKELFRMMIEDNVVPKTSQPSPQDFLQKFEEAKAAGDEVICILLSSALSGTVQAARLAKDLAEYDKIYIVDSLTATVGIKMMADYAQKLAAENRSAEEIVEILEAMKSRVRIVAAVDTLKFLYLGGRVSKTVAVIADAVTIKPGIYITQDGKVGLGSKYLGVSRAVKDLTRHMKTAKMDPDFPLYLIYSHNDGNAQKLEKSLLDAGIEGGVKYELGSTLGVHIGPGAFGVIYMEKA